jgi:hypothetical protein
MGKQKSYAHQLALKWWATKSKQSSGHCDICGADINRGEGYLCKHFVQGLVVPGTTTILDLGSGSPDMLCEKCFDEIPSARPVKSWWEFWK